MPFPSVFEQSTTDQALTRLEKLQPDTTPQWGKMNAPQMLAHLNVAYDLAYGRTRPRINGLMRFFLKTFVKPIVVGEKPYKKNSRTAPYFLVANQREFVAEKAKLIENIRVTQDKGAGFFEGKTSDAFGKLSAREWSTQFYKHMDHHFTQFGI